MRIKQRCKANVRHCYSKPSKLMRGRLNSQIELTRVGSRTHYPGSVNATHVQLTQTRELNPSTLAVLMPCPALPVGLDRVSLLMPCEALPFTATHSGIRKRSSNNTAYPETRSVHSLRVFARGAQPSHAGGPLFITENNVRYSKPSLVL